MQSNLVEFFGVLVAAIIPFLPVLFGAVEWVKSKFKLSGGAVEAVSSGIFVIYAALVILAYFFPSWGFYIAGGFVFLLAAAIAPSGFYKFVNVRTDRRDQ